MNDRVKFRKPTPVDGPAIHRLVKACPPLDENSRYCNLLQASHFADTAILAEKGGELIGFITGYTPPGSPDVLFVWQVAVAEAARGMKLARRMLEVLTDRLGVAWVETTVTPDNVPSARMFEGFARTRSAAVKRSVMFSGDTHFEGLHDDEVLFRIGPLQAAGGAAARDAASGSL